jgi:hypothetical protein
MSEHLIGLNQKMLINVLTSNQKILIRESQVLNEHLIVVNPTLVCFRIGIAIQLE